VTRVKGMAGKNPTITALFQLNGYDRFQVRDVNYFNWVQPYQHHTNIPAVGINVYSFALQPEQYQPSGTCNLSRIDNTTLLLTVSNNAVGTNLSSTVCVYATNYNVLFIRHVCICIQPVFLSSRKEDFAICKNSSGTDLGNCALFFTPT
jgi:hypothetical protein